jgi:hypothetical protein
MWMNMFFQFHNAYQEMRHAASKPNQQESAEEYQDGAFGHA